MIRTTLARCNAFVLQKNYLAKKKSDGLMELAEDLAGLPAEPSTTPFLAANARLQNFPPDTLLTEWTQSRRLIQGDLMRTSPYLVTANQFVAWHAATARQRNQDFNAEFRLWGLESNEEIEQLGQKILAVLGDRPATANSVAEHLPQSEVKTLSQTSRGGRVTQTTNVALTLRWLAARGRLAVINESTDWRDEQLAYVPFSQWYPDLDSSQPLAEAEAQKALVRAYLGAFGPATEADISFWSGFGKSETARAVSALSSETMLTMVEGIPGMLLSLKKQADILKSTEALSEPVVNVLPANDPFMIAHRASRSRYFGDQKLQRRLFSSSGAAKPAILVNGRVVGLWQWQTDKEGDQLTWELLDEVDSQITAKIQAEIERVGHFISANIDIRQTDV